MIASAPNPWSLVSCSSLTPPCRKLPSFETPSLKNTLFFQLLASKLSSSWTAPELSQPERVPHSTQHDAHRLFNISSSTTISPSQFVFPLPHRYEDVHRASEFSAAAAARDSSSTVAFPTRSRFLLVPTGNCSARFEVL